MVRNIIIAVIAIIVIIFILVLAGVIELGDEAVEAVDPATGTEEVIEE